jgi:Ca2+-binding EF-hand superfamily protein
LQNNKLGLAATSDEVSALFLDLDSDGNGSVDYSEFLNWYLDVSTAATDRSSEVRVS